MLKNFLKIAFRNLSRNKLYSSINIFDELSYDKHHKDADRTYRPAYTHRLVWHAPMAAEFHLQDPPSTSIFIS